MPFCFNVPSECTPLFNLSCLIFGILPFAWFIYIHLRRLFGNIIFDLCTLYQKQKYVMKQGLGVQFKERNLAE
jgi:hypothetical protein